MYIVPVAVIYRYGAQTIRTVDILLASNFPFDGSMIDVKKNTDYDFCDIKIPALVISHIPIYRDIKDYFIL